jgi:hypothetical protein
MRNFICSEMHASGQVGAQLQMIQKPTREPEGYLVPLLLHDVMFADLKSLGMRLQEHPKL